MQDSYQLIGLFAKGGMFPNFLITVLKKNLELFGLLPSGHLVSLVKDGGIPMTEEDCLARPTYCKYGGPGIAGQELAELRSFGFSKEHIIIGSRGSLEEEIQKHIMQPDLPEKDLAMLKEILSNLEKHRPALQLVF